MDLGRITYRGCNADETHSVRSVVLRPGLPLETCSFDGDLLPSTLHWCAESEEKILGVLSCMEEPFPEDTKEIKGLRLRGMATLAEVRGMGVGACLLRHAWGELQKREKASSPSPLVWFHARIGAAGFYTRLGFKTSSGEAYELPGVGPHLLQYLELSNHLRS